MGQLVSNIFESFSTVLTGLSSGLTTAFNNLLYTNGNIEGGFNPLVTFVFTMAGVGLAAGILWAIFGLIKGNSHRAG